MPIKLPRIYQLDRQVSNLIAAGEVVERPASVVKELVENAVDAGSTAVTVEIVRGGLSLIRVSDNGCGIAGEDIPTAFLRHATSKVRTAEDLASIATMGFRGEALASVAAVSRTELRSRPAGELAGSRYRIEGGEAQELEEVGMQEGTTVEVRDLFYNTPARMKFVKNEAAESGAVQTVVRAAALARPDIAYTFLRDGVRVFGTPGDGKLSAAVYAVYGGEFAAGLTNVNLMEDGISVRGYVSKPAYTQGNRRRQEFYVNQRPINSRLLSAAVEDAYRGRLMLGRFPACVLHLDLPFDAVDVNVHPAKTEVKFADEPKVRELVRRAVSEALDERDTRVEFRTKPSAAPVPAQPRPAVIPTAPKVSEAAAALDFYAELTPKEYRKLAGLPEKREPEKPSAPPEEKQETPSIGFSLRTLAPVDRQGSELHQQKLAFDYLTDHKAKPEETPEPETSVQAEPEAKPEAGPEKTETAADWRIIGEAFDTYILVEQGEDLLLIDKHAAHERIRYEALLEADAGSMTQLLLQPVVFTPEAAERELLLGERELLREIGFELEDFGGGSLIVRTAPDEVASDEVEATLDEIADSLAVSRKLTRTEKREAALRLVSCKSALKAGSVTTPAEREALVRRVIAFDDIRYCPHGRPVAALLTKSEIEKRMGRQI